MLKTGHTTDLESVIQFVDDLLDVAQHPDYPTALNGLQVAAPADRPVRRVAAAVDASEAIINQAVERDVDLLVVHHGLFWDGLRPVTGRRYRKLERLIGAGIAVHAVHLPLDAHPEIGNAALLARAIGVVPTRPFGDYQGAPIGWAASLEEAWSPSDLERRVAEAVGGRVQRMGHGPDAIHSVAVVTGSGGSLLETAAREGVHALVTGEAAHHHYMDACELGVHLFLAGHYATETFGVRALVARIADHFGVESLFLDDPSGL